jgi:hypothetical protein
MGGGSYSIGGAYIPDFAGMYQQARSRSLEPTDSHVNQIVAKGRLEVVDKLNKGQEAGTSLTRQQPWQSSENVQSRQRK